MQAGTRSTVGSFGSAFKIFLIQGSTEIFGSASFSKLSRPYSR